MLTASYLAIAHYRVYIDPSYRSFCALTRAINCDTVAQSEYAVFMAVPLAVWGMLGYAGFGLLLGLACGSDARPRRLWSLLTVAALFFSLLSLVLALISVLYIHSYCIMCLLSYAVNFSLLFTCWLVWSRFKQTSFLVGVKEDLRYMMSRPMRILFSFAPFALTAILMVAYYPAYWVLDPPPLNPDVVRGETAEGHPWIGAQNPQLEIVEFSDYLCFQCRKMHYMLRQLVERHPDKIRLVHRHFPMDHRFNPLVTESFHFGAGKLALLAIGAAQAGRFWEVNDLLFEEAFGRDVLTPAYIADRVKMDASILTTAMNDPATQRLLMLDIRDGLQQGLTGTPGFLVNGQFYVGQLPADLLKSFID